MASLFLLAPRWGGTVYATLIIILLLVAKRDDGSFLGRKLIAWTAPFVLPLLLVHGVLNSQFPVTSWWLDMIPIRGSGWIFGYDLALRILVCSVVSAFWLSVDRDALVDALLQLRLPTSFIMLAIQGFVMGRLVQDRIRAIHLAQRARGIPVSASLKQRITSVPALLIPVVVSTFVEAEARVPVLLAHGYGRLEPFTQSTRFNVHTAILTVGILGCLMFAMIADQFR